MKKTSLLLIGMVSCFFASAQVLDKDLNNRVESLERLTKDLNESNQILTYNLDKYQNQRATGLLFLALGSFFTVTAATPHIAGFESSVKSSTNTLFVLGGGCLITSQFFLIDCGKWITNKKKTKHNNIK
jgi:hypothetical protein